MTKFLPQKKKLIAEVFETAGKNTTETSFSGILKDLENTLKDDFNIYLSYKSFETYYKVLVEKNKDYNIKPLILDDLSKYLGYENFKTYCEKNALIKETSSVKINVDGKEESDIAKNFTDIIINITNSPIFNFPEFVTKHKNSFGIAGILLVAGFIFNKADYFKGKKEENFQPLKMMSESMNATNFSNESINKNEIDPTKIIVISEKNNATQSEKTNDRSNQKDCMYWNEVEYIPVFCNENIANFQVIQRNEDFLKLKKITRPDTLTTENAIGKVWYDKSNRKVEFFTYHGIHPENGKTLRNVTNTILEKYAK